MDWVCAASLGGFGLGIFAGWMLYVCGYREGKRRGAADAVVTRLVDDIRKERNE